VLFNKDQLIEWLQKLLKTNITNYHTNVYRMIANEQLIKSAVKYVGVYGKQTYVVNFTYPVKPCKKQV